MGKYSLLAKNTLLVFGGGIGAKLITLFMMPLYTRWLSVDGYGEMDLITVYVTLLISIVSFCIPEALFVFPCGATKSKQKSYFTSGVLFNFLTLIVTFIIFLNTNYLSKCYNWNNSFTDNIWLIYSMLVSGIIQQQVQQFSRSTNHMIVYSVTGIIFAICVLLLSFYFVKYYGVNGYVYCITIANIVSALFCSIFSKIYKYIDISYFNISVIKEMLFYSIPLIPNSVMWWFVNALNRPIMEDELGMHDVGIYAVASRFPGVLSVLFTMFTASWQISAIEEFNSNGYKVFYNRILKLVFNILIIILIGIVLFSKILVKLLADSSFYNAWLYIPILTYGTFISCISAFIGVNFSASRESKYFFYSSLFGALASVSLNFILIPMFGMWGACISVVISFFVIALSRWIYANKYVRISNISYYLLLLFIVSIIIVTYTLNYMIISCILALILFIYIIISNRQELTIIKSKIKSSLH